MKRYLLILLSLLMLFCTAGCQEDTENPDSFASEESHTPQYVIDEVVNRFILTFRGQKRYVLAGLTQGSDGSCTAEIDQCQIKMTSTAQGLHVALQGGSTTEARDRMLDIFATIAKTVDVSCTARQVEDATAYLKEQTGHIGAYRVSNYVKVLGYVPVIATDTVQVDCRMEMLVMHYLPEE